jgi:predicted RNA methylase
MSVLVATARLLHECSEVLNDRRFCLRTAGFLLQSQAGVTHPDAEVYAATPYRVFRRLLRHVPGECFGGTFIDYGCGRGRVAILAAAAGFRQVVGVELSSRLLRDAESNLGTCRMARGRWISFVQADAAQFPVPDDTQVAFLYKPFGSATTAQVLGRIRESLKRCPREFRLLGYNSDLLEGLAREHLRAEVIARGTTVYPSIPWAALRVRAERPVGIGN